MEKVASLLRDSALSVKEIADRSELEEPRVREILAGSEVSMFELRALCSGLNISVTAFSQGMLFSDSSQPLRALFRLGERRTDLGPTIGKIAIYVTSALRILPDTSHAHAWFQQFEVREKNYTEAHRLAQKFRQVFLSDRLDEPILDLPKLLCDQNLVHLALLTRSNLDGVSVTMSGYAFIFLSQRFPGRMLFTLAHELGHVITDHSDGGATIFDQSSEEIRKNQNREDESFVNAFASILLLPERGVGRFLHTVRETLEITNPSLGDIELLMLARYYGVSFDVAARRCEDLTLLPKGAAVAMSERLKQEFGSAEKRATSAGLPPRQHVEFPRISHQLLDVIVNAIDEGVVTTGWASDRFGFSIGELFDWHANSRSAISS